MRFAKLHGAGNDFLLFDEGAEAGLADRLPALVARLCHRHTGIGADGVLLVRPAGEKRVSVLYWNADGSRAAFCANGTRCAAGFVARRWGWPRMVLDTDFAAVGASVSEGQVTLTLPPPTSVVPWRSLAVGDEQLACRYGVLGVPHLITEVAWCDFWGHPLAPLGAALRAHQELPAGGANVSFVQRRGNSALAARSWERGVEGETLSCGSGNVFAVLVGLEAGWVKAPVQVHTASGRVLVVEPDGKPPGCGSRLTGAAEWVADGDVAPELTEEQPVSMAASS